MRSSVLLVTCIISMTPLASAAQVQKPYDPYRWCAVYSGRMGGATNCGFITLEQCRATVSGIGGFCQPNPFYNPRKPRRSKH
jgi:hypothetical protein